MSTPKFIVGHTEGPRLGEFLLNTHTVACQFGECVQDLGWVASTNTEAATMDLLSSHKQVDQVECLVPLCGASHLLVSPGDPALDSRVAPEEGNVELA